MQLSRKEKILIAITALAVAVMLAIVARAQAATTCNITGNLTFMSGASGANTTITFSTPSGPPQNANGSIIPFSTASVVTDSNGNIPANSVNLPYSAIADVQVCSPTGCNNPFTIQVPKQTQADITTLFLAQHDPPSLITSINCVSGCSVINPPPGAFGQASLTITGGGGGSSFPLTSNVSASGFEINSLGPDVSTGDALSRNQSSMNSLLVPTTSVGMNGQVFTNLGCPTAVTGAPIVTNCGFGTPTNLNTSVGRFALESLTSGTSNTAVGNNALPSITSGAGDTAVGSAALFTNTKGNNDTAIGNNALASFNNSSGGSDYNTAIGASACQSDTTGNNNTCLGAGGNLTTGSHNILIGSNLAGTTATSSFQLDIGDTIEGTLVGGGTPDISILAPVNHLTTTIGALPSCVAGLAGAVASITNNDAACAINGTPAHSTCTVGTNCFTCQVQCAEAGSTSYAWIIY